MPTQVKAVFADAHDIVVQGPVIYMAFVCDTIQFQAAFCIVIYLLQPFVTHVCDSIQFAPTNLCQDHVEIQSVPQILRLQTRTNFHFGFALSFTSGTSQTETSKTDEQMKRCATHDIPFGKNSLRSSKSVC